MDLPSDAVVHVIQIAGIGFLAWLNAMANNKVSNILLKQAENKAELLAQQQLVKEDLDTKHGENQKMLGEHMVEDRVTFANIEKSLIRIESRQKRNGTHND